MNDELSGSRNGHGSEISDETLKRVRAELGLPDSITTDVEGLRTVYAAWCNAMTFDNIRKLISLRTGDERLAGGEAENYFQHWLANRSGGTCWPSSNALFGLIASYGFEARRVAGAMFDLPVVNHGSVKVRIDGIDWLADSSMLTVEPLPLKGELLIKTEGPVRVEVEPRNGSYLIWTDFPPMPEFIPCGLRDDPVDLNFYLERYEASREMSPFNERLYLRKVTPDGLTVFLGNTMFQRVGEELEVRELSADELLAAMHEIGGVSEAFISRWVDAGGLNATMNFSGQGPELPDPGPRPSRRSK
ncbi:MAG TPA: arylamine N-acetyltransferase [Pyrinomonadaceae bacterium]|nr:arylamine N-acetyltransferase [Pyrinomonadaceae bacterium]